MAGTVLLTLKAMGSGNVSSQNSWSVKNNTNLSSAPRSKISPGTRLNFGLLNVNQTQPAPLPGNTHIGCSPRPLGLLPHKRRRDMWNELGVLMHNIGRERNGLSSRLKGTTSTSFTMGDPNPGSHQTLLTKGETVPAMLAQQNHCSDAHIDDPEYLNTLALCDMKKYNVQATNEQWSSGGTGGDQHVLFKLPTYGTASTAGCNIPVTIKGRKYGKMKNHEGNKSLEYLSFFGQAQLNKRALFTDCRNSKEFEPCERCALRGTRCGHCKAIRTGGGYIILDGLSALDYIGESSFGFDSANNDGSRRLKSSLSSRGSHRSRAGNGSEINYGETDMETDKDGHNNSNTRMDIAHKQTNRFQDEDMAGSGGNDVNKKRGTDEEYKKGPESSGVHSNKPKDGSDSTFHDGLSDYYRVKTNGRDGLNNGRTDGSDGSHEEYTDGSEKNTTGRNLDDRFSKQREYNQGGKDAHFDNGGIHESTSKDDIDFSRGQSGEQNGEGKTRDGKRQILENKKYGRQRNISNSSRVNFDIDHTAIDTDKDRATNYNTKGERDLNESTTNATEREGSAHHYGDLMKFKTKNNKVRAKSCTLRELKGIDPLDYLAKYCIIDQEKVPHYQRVFENVDMDEDGEIDVLELDFALKAVNYNLISDAELVFVNKVLELAGRYALNFQLFTLVAALSEKVVSLEDMVRRLVNELDFEALETKMKKCKELFYLLANHDDDGVVTTTALGIELQAGGLTEEHVEYVINHLEHEDKGTVEFLDYLVYVPLFVEIHGSINDNPLNFDRTK